MSQNTSFCLGDHFSDFVENQVGQGRYNSASDVVRAGLRLLEEQEIALAALRAAPSMGRTATPRRLSILKISLLENDGTRRPPHERPVHPFAPRAG